MKFTRISLISKQETTRDLPITPEQLAKWKAGALVQDAFPNLTPDEREFIKSGITAEEWDEIFGGPEEEEEQ